MEQLADELAGQDFTQTDHGITQHEGHFLLQHRKLPLSDTLCPVGVFTKIALLHFCDIC